MSGLEVIGAISTVIGILDASIKIYDSVRKDSKLPETFQTVGRHLPILLDTLRTCKTHLDPMKDSLPADVSAALEKNLDACEDNAGKLRQIFEKVLPGENDAWHKRYVKVVQRLGKGSRVEELMISITHDVQLVVNHDAVRSANPAQNAELEKIVQEMKAVPSSVPEDEGAGLTFNSGGGAQTNNVNRGSGQQINNNAAVSTQNINPVIKQRDDFSFRRPVGNCLGQAPYIDSELFIGRQSEMEKMRKTLKPGDQAHKQQRLVLGGMGGIGKTQLAIAYASHHRDDFDSVFWLNAASEATLKDSFRTMAQVIFDVQEPGLLEGEQILIHTHRWLSDKNNTRWLLIFDNYDDPDQFNIRSYYPPISHGAVVVTTRLPHLVEGIPLKIKPLQNIEEGLEILQTRSQRENVTADAHARCLADRLAGLPLALATAGAYLRQSSITFARYLDEYEKQLNITLQRRVQLPEYEDRTLYTTWALSYARLEGEDPDAARLLKLLAYFDNQNLWYELFHAGRTNRSPEWLQEVIADDITFDRVMSNLTDYCFVEVQTGRQSWSMHTCVHDWTVAALNPVIDVQQYRYAFDCVAASINEADQDSLGHLAYARLAAHAMQLLRDRFYQHNTIDDIIANRLDGAFDIAELLHQQVQLVAAQQIYLRVLAGYEKSLGSDHTSTLNIVHNLGNVYYNQRKLDEAEQMYQRALIGKEKALGASHTLTLNTVNSLGNLCSGQGKLDEAEQMYQRALAGYEKALGSDHTSTLNTVHNLGSLYRGQGKLDEAEQMYQRALAGYEKALGSNHTSTLETVNNLGNLYCGQGKLDEAEQMFQRALAGFQKALGSDHPSTLTVTKNIEQLAFERRQR